MKKNKPANYSGEPWARTGAAHYVGDQKEPLYSDPLFTKAGDILADNFTGIVEDTNNLGDTWHTVLIDGVDKLQTQNKTTALKAFGCSDKQISLIKQQLSLTEQQHQKTTASSKVLDW